MTKQNIIEKCEGTQIQWKEGKNVTEKKVKKKSKNKKTNQSKTVTKTVEQESFFNFFKTVEMPAEDALAKEEDDEEKNVGDKMDEDFDLGNEFKDQLIPLALEYYMEVIEEEEDDGCDSCGDDHHDHDSDDDQPKGGKGKKKGDNKKAEAGQDK
jgi:nucleosome assembly protein 1-like 1